MDKILNYIHQKYEPLSIIVYGSYEDGSNNENSDFDADTTERWIDYLSKMIRANCVND